MLDPGLLFILWVVVLVSVVALLATVVIIAVAECLERRQRFAAPEDSAGSNEARSPERP